MKYDIEKTFNDVTAEDIKNALYANQFNVEREFYWGLPVIVIDGCEWAVAENEDQANTAAGLHIYNSVCYFTPSFLAQHSDVPEEVFEFLAVKGYSDNEAYLAMIYEIGDFIEDAIDADGRGHFLNGYDGKEEKIGNYFLYRCV